MAIAKEFDMKFWLDSPEKLGRWLQNMKQTLEKDYEIGYGQSRLRESRGRWWSFSVLPDAKSDDRNEESDDRNGESDDRNGESDDRN